MQKVNIDEDVSINSMPSIDSAASHAGNLEEEHAEDIVCDMVIYLQLSDLNKLGEDVNNGWII